jgi:hypothetical protein
MLIAGEYDGSASRMPGLPGTVAEVETLVVRVAEENRDWGYSADCLRSSTALPEHACTKRPVAPHSEGNAPIRECAFMCSECMVGDPEVEIRAAHCVSNFRVARDPGAIRELCFMVQRLLNRCDWQRFDAGHHDSKRYDLIHSHAGLCRDSIRTNNSMHVQRIPFD